MFDPVESVGDEGLIRAVQRFWDTESLGIFEPNPSLEKEFLRDSNFDKNQGRYQMSLPWKDDLAGELKCSKVDETVLTEVKPLGSKQDVFTNSTEKENRTERDSNEANDDILSARSEADDDPKPECSIKILGLNWNINTDEIHYDLTALSDELSAFAEITKPKIEPTITRALANVTITPPNVEAIMDCNRYSTKEQLLRVTALLKRFGDKTRRQPVPIEVTANELRAAEKLWVNTIQASNFEDERSYLQGVSKKEPLLVRQLDLFLDEEEIRSSCKQKNETHARDPTTEETKEDASSKEPLKANARSTVVTKYFLRSQNNRKDTEWKGLGINHLHLPTPDFNNAPDPEKLKEGVRFIKQFDSRSTSCYVHCKAGRGRSAALVACYLMEMYQLTPPEAIDILKSKREQTLLGSNQLTAINKFYQHTRTNSSTKL
ncbi:phosphatidylglycerophosphatase and -tyrosine phosphatase 1 [Paramuricea clavata]|uniref:Phosphatidylglycerophosphatase and -tyrosine phosphatase 1 n=2 Tax=Paramuricea clavata TaxID=317549 RepID=A0A6S7G7Z0_PARCT|nr:phosphatidylglycerophosphatase and -tyrosine phosphatase 1 [Paramuricea clavata]